MNDVIRLAMEQAADSFGGHDGKFNGAGLSAALNRIAHLRGQTDGKMIRVLLAGRRDVALLTGGSHYQLIDR